MHNARFLFRFSCLKKLAKENEVDMKLKFFIIDSDKMQFLLPTFDHGGIYVQKNLIW